MDKAHASLRGMSTGTQKSRAKISTIQKKRDETLEQIDAVVIGAGVVGLAVGRELALHGLEVMVLESENAIGTGTSSRNSEVIHAGIYYPAGSLKARLCVQGKQLLYAYCADRGVAHRRLGKLIVDAVFNRDYAVVQGVVLVTATVYILLNLLADVLYVLANPRLRA